MLPEHKELLAKIQEAEAIATRIYNGGVEGIGRVVRQLRTARDTVDERVKALAESAATAPVRKPKPAAPPPNTPPTDPPKSAATTKPGDPAKSD